ncbi:helix-turn-helix domain-containing protein [Pseudoclavibacter sp. VKM Ac-2867]|uniref:helix-turn-helix domain-containing protein n=1 Tax=Pseudoclavibacter sp. VKM Ac-2867 TaxID=2783829 RepID=UPI00188DA5D7|nr:AraC family transcriptional regulator [Pseudoclavibacter sp. VKM Ac-2867]MBF4459700.1 helix-turn-helix transcriptional regulator [Pseudoclavibacter sp. VKM Ac-2867]
MTEFGHSTSIPHLEARRSAQENSCYRAHTHDSFSIGLIDSGASRFAGLLSGPVRLDAGDVILIPAGRVHSCNPLDGRWQYQMIHADQAWLTSLVPPETAASLSDSITIIRDPLLRAAVAEAFSAIFADHPAPRLRATFSTLLRQLDGTHAELVIAGTMEPQLLTALAPAMERLQGDASNPRLDELGELVGMDRFQFIREMKRATGLSPLAWRQNARVLQARRMLRAGESIAYTAHSLGFVDQSHFHRVFRAHVAASPGTYRRRRNFIQDPPTP